MRYQRCIDLWRRALQIRIDKDTMLYTDTCFTAQALVRLMIDYNIRSNINKEDRIKQRFHDIISTFRLITTDIVGKFNFCFHFICVNLYFLLIYLVYITQVIKKTVKPGHFKHFANQSIFRRETLAKQMPKLCHYFLLKTSMMDWRII